MTTNLDFVIKHKLKELKQSHIKYIMYQIFCGIYYLHSKTFHYYRCWYFINLFN
jgi:hypothetical protein